MANNERLTKRVKKIEEWVAENEVMGGPKGYMDTMVAMYQSNVSLASQNRELNSTFNQLRNFAFGGDRNFKDLTTLLDCEFLSEFGFAGSRFTLKQQRFFQQPGNMKSFSELFVQEVGRGTFEK